MLQSWIHAVILILNLIFPLSSLEISSWTLSNANGSITIKNVATPVDVYSALYHHSVIGWPLKGFNDVAYRWIAYDNWTFTSNTFDTPPSNQSLLSVSGLDVYPMIMLNNHRIQTTSSEFYTADIPINSNLLKLSNNILRIQFTSPPLLAMEISNEYNNKIAPECWPKLFNGECHINMLRKTQSSFGWDWGPAIPTMGIRGTIELRMTNKMSVFIKGVRFSPSSNDNCRDWTADVFVKLRVLQVVKGSTISVTTSIENLGIKMVQYVTTNDASIYFANFTFKVDSVRLKLWWPRELGTPDAYKLEVTVAYHDLVMDKSINYVGFRRVDLNQSYIPAYSGRHFQFNVNCRPFFVKGTNWVPRSYLTFEWNNKSYLEFILNSVADANINTIRLWGGGRPEMKLFYTIADRLGIMIWHDLMFAGSLYPDDHTFLDEINNEITDLLWNTQIHPSILLWSGNNEIELLIAEGWYQTKPMDPRNIASYYKTFFELIKPLVTSLDPFTPFVLSSPSNGIESERHQGVAKNPQSHYFGDVHFYLYFGDLWDERSYPITRMTTEFGFQSYPSTNTWALIILSENDFEPNGTLANHRQHLDNGFEISESSILKYFGQTKPPGLHSPRDKYTWFSYLSQINQAIILKVHINRLRTSQCFISSNSDGYTSGAMFWQLNDNWIAPSWSTIESNGQWKLAHYYVKSAFTKERIIVTRQDKTITIRLVFPEVPSVVQYKLVLTCVDSSKNVTVAVTGLKSMLIDTRHLLCNVATVLSMPVLDFLNECHCTNMSNCIVEGSLLSNGTQVSVDTAIMVHPKDLHLPNAVSRDVIKFKIRNDDPDLSVCVITLNSEFVHLFVSLTTNSLGKFSTNGFHLWKKEYNVTFYPWYYKQSEFFNCSNLKLGVISLNGLYAQ